MKLIVFLFMTLALSSTITCAKESQESSGSDKHVAEVMRVCKGFDGDTKACQKAIDSTVSNIKQFQVNSDFLVPDSPAFDALGVKPEVVNQPSSVKALSLSLLNSTDASGNAQNGVAVDFAPYKFSSRNKSIFAYRNSFFERVKTNTQISFGTSKGSDSNDKSVKWSVGLRTTLFDAGDPYLDNKIYEAAFKEYGDLTREQQNAKDNLDKAKSDNRILRHNLKKAKNKLDRLSTTKTKDITAIEEAKNEVSMHEKALKAFEPTLNKAISDYNKINSVEFGKLKEQQTLGNWNASSMSIGIAPVFVSTEGNYSDSDYETLVVYASLAYGFDNFKANFDRETGGWLSKNAQLLIHARYVDNELEALNDGGNFREQDKSIFGIQGRLRGPSIFSKSPDSLVFIGEVSYIDKKIKDKENEDAYRYSLGVAVKPISGSSTTIRAVAGEESDNGADNQSFVSITLNFAS